MIAPCVHGSRAARRRARVPNSTRVELGYEFGGSPRLEERVRLPEIANRRARRDRFVATKTVGPGPRPAFGTTVQPDGRISTCTRSASITEPSLPTNRVASAGATMHVARTPMTNPAATTRRMRLRSLDWRILRRSCYRNLIGPDGFRKSEARRCLSLAENAPAIRHRGYGVSGWSRAARWNRRAEREIESVRGEARHSCRLAFRHRGRNGCGPLGNIGGLGVPTTRLGSCTRPASSHSSRYDGRW